LPKKCTAYSLNFGLGAELINIAVFSLIFDVRKKIFRALDRGVPCLAFLFLTDD